jgi:riboflavin synthase
MFTGIIEAIAEVVAVEKQQDNITFTFTCPFTNELKKDQSLAHNGVCLTVIDVFDTCYKVTAIKETLNLTNLSQLNKGDLVNIERCVKVNGRFDGHVVQGHIDQTARCIEITPQNGSHVFSFEYDARPGNILVKKGSVTVNGVSLTVADCIHNTDKNIFSVAIIPYTYENTTFKQLKANDIVNIEFDIIGKYIKEYLRSYIK